MSDDPVADLLIKVARQDRAAFQAVYNDASAKLMGVCLRILGTRSVAEDALQDVGAPGAVGSVAHFLAHDAVLEAALVTQS